MRLLALLAALAAAPAAAAIKPAACLHPVSGAAPSSLDQLRACQGRARAAAAAAAARRGTPLTDAQLEAIDEFQRAEARKYLAQPGVVVTGPPETAPPAEPAGASGKLGAAERANLSRVDPKSAAAIRGLQTRLHAAAGDGRNGVTPAMAGDITSTLIQTQGSVSPDMQNLLNAVSRDGGQLTPDTMKKLQGAGEAAKGEGLDLGLDPAAENQLLHHDYDADKPAFNAAHPPGAL